MSDPFYRSAEWRRLRTTVLRCDPVCGVPGCDRQASHVDHIRPRSEGGPDSLANLRALCASCHNRRTAAGNAPPRAVGCDARGLPLDPAHPFLVGGKSLGAEGLGPPGSRARSKFRPRGGC